MTETEFHSAIIHGVRTGKIVAWLDKCGEVRLIVAEQATALHRRLALSAEAVAVMVSEKKTSFDEF